MRGSIPQPLSTTVKWNGIEVIFEFGAIHHDVVEHDAHSMQTADDVVDGEAVERVSFVQRRQSDLWSARRAPLYDPSVQRQSPRSVLSRI